MDYKKLWEDLKSSVVDNVDACEKQFQDASQARIVAISAKQTFSKTKKMMDELEAMQQKEELNDKI